MSEQHVHEWEVVIYYDGHGRGTYSVACKNCDADHCDDFEEFLNASLARLAALERVARDIAGSNPWMSGEYRGEICLFCTSSSPEPHEPDCTWLLAHAAVDALG